MIDKKFLEGLGITDEETVGKITAEYDSGIKAEKDTAASVQTQLAEANKQIESFREMDVEAIKKSADDWKQKYEASEAERASFEHKTKINSFVKKLGLKDDIYESHLAGQLIEKGLKFEGDKLIGWDDVVSAFKSAYPGAFKEKQPQTLQFSYPTSSGKQTTVSGVEAAFLAKNPDLKID